MYKNGCILDLFGYQEDRVVLLLLIDHFLNCQLSTRVLNIVRVFFHLCFIYVAKIFFHFVILFSDVLRYN